LQSIEKSLGDEKEKESYLVNLVSEYIFLFASFHLAWFQN